MHTATTNVPGPQQPVQTLGRRMLESYPFIPVVGSIRIVVGIFSYDGGLYFGVTGDYDGAPDIDILTKGIRNRDDGPAGDRRPAAGPGQEGQDEGQGQSEGQSQSEAGTGRRLEPPAGASRQGTAGRSVI